MSASKRCTRHWLSAATTATSRRVGMPSQMRSSTVPKPGWGRMSHQTSRMVAMVRAVISVSMKLSNWFQPASCHGGPAVGRPSNTLLRQEASPVSWPIQ